jgi:hypothetical protein
MAHDIKPKFLNELDERFGPLKKLTGSQSLYELGEGQVRLYIRYSKIHSRSQGFYGLRKSDLDKLDGFRSYVVFLWDDQEFPLMIPSTHLMPLIEQVSLASDGQYKAGVYLGESGTELYFAGIGRFGVDGFFGWSGVESAMVGTVSKTISQFTHSQWQTIVGSLGSRKGFDIWIPTNNRSSLDWSVAPQFPVIRSIPPGYLPISNVIEEIDVMWIARGAQSPTALFEIEYSTPIYSGLLRFNDVHLVAPKLKPRFHIIADEDRRSLFVRLINRPTFKVSGLVDVCSFMDYQQVTSWHETTTQE